MDFEVTQIYNFPKYLLKNNPDMKHYPSVCLFFSSESKYLSSEQAEKQQEDFF